MREKVVFFGAGPYVAPIIEALNKDFDLRFVVTTETGQNGDLILYLENKDINYISIKEFDRETLEKIKKFGAKIAVLAYFGTIVPKSVLDIFPLGIINIHPSLLPKYRGASPGQAAILNGDPTTGVSIIKLDEEVDHGLMLAQIEEIIKLNDTSETLYRRLFQKGAVLLSQVLPKYISGELKPVEQNHSKATFTERLTRESGLIDLTKPPQPPKLARMIRAYYPWPTVWFRAKLNGKEKIIKLLPEEKIQVEGKKIMRFADFANGYPEGHSILSRLSPVSTRSIRGGLS
ncbi:MAG: hypothetical protein A3G66_04415 [Candidatus Levybacteria bacterium RIFCSPLOWO2_12_FULL_39_17]|uniref:methionyl-tRNA formyltransferase n=1 Tax=Candidatus Woesebacteria bacterium GW2011_GWA1_43_12 TaxID=1618557 RepID=A0A0G1CX52_9BACT|nr:MAG: Methionyl-tRNA formyltransferase [Candidatus Woesebacteria bacterium GW2011_GWA1_43_12]OGH45133.1 MAG: hypothetical protein A3H82_02395 [Candidatus Levybacteria bacterium RIFCSPLOWO2_02_FULL_39_26]OGH46991.1 MAG: hypothetical protein A3G66_04415 [Candidatus Levybacteria bacterium RIFCSPLOWO2_12_FULL_39_17]